MFISGLVPLHGGAMVWWKSWHFEPIILGGLAIAAYAWSVKNAKRRGDIPPGETGHEARYLVPFISGLILIFLAEGTPLHTLSELYLFSVHMLQHVLLYFGAAPLLILGIPGWFAKAWVERPTIYRILRVLTHPIIALVSFNFVYSAWHLPGLYQAALVNHGLHAVQHAMTMFVALLAWWPVLGRAPELQVLSDPVRLLYVFVNSIAQIVVFAYVTFHSSVLYPFYADAPRIWDITVEQDQVLAGVVMMIGTSAVLITTLAWIFFRWMNSEERREKPRTSQANLTAADERG